MRLNRPSPHEHRSNYYDGSTYAEFTHRFHAAHSRTRRMDASGSLRASATSLGVRLAGRRALKPSMSLTQLANQPMVTNCNLLAKPSNGAAPMARC